MNALILHERDLLTLVKAKVKQRVKMTSDEFQTQKQRERFASPVKSISPSDDPKFKINPETQEELSPRFIVDLQLIFEETSAQQDRQRRTELLVSKLIVVLREDSSSVVENRDVFM